MLAFCDLQLIRVLHAGLWWDASNAKKWLKLDTKGMENIRRSSSLLCNQLVQNWLDTLLIDRSPANGIAFVKENVGKLMRNEIDVSLLIPLMVMAFGFALLFGWLLLLRMRSHLNEKKARALSLYGQPAARADDSAALPAWQ